MKRIALLGLLALTEASSLQSQSVKSLLAHQGEAPAPGNGTKLEAKAPTNTSKAAPSLVKQTPTNKTKAKVEAKKVQAPANSTKQQQAKKEAPANSTKHEVKKAEAPMNEKKEQAVLSSPPANSTKHQTAPASPAPSNSAKNQEVAAPALKAKNAPASKKEGNSSKSATTTNKKKLSPLELRRLERVKDKLRQQLKNKKVPLVEDNYHPDLQTVIHRNSNTTLINATGAWNQLNDREKNYAYYISKASWAGSKMVFHQMSYESPPLFLIFQAFFQDKNSDQIFANLKKYGVSQNDYKAFTAYAANFYNNMGTYNSFGQSKFVPEIKNTTFRTILERNPIYAEATARGELYRYLIKEVYPMIEKEIFALEKPYNVLGFPKEGGVTGYFGRNMDRNDLKLVKEFLEHQGLDVLNTRAFKSAPDHYQITIGSISHEKSMKDIPYNGKLFDLEYGEFSSYLLEVVKYLRRAADFAANDNERQMIEKYIDHFESGSVNLHKLSQTFWVHDKSPVVESNLGWVEHYIDPQKQRAVWEGWVAIVDKERSKKFKTLVDKADKVVSLLPWDKKYEKDKFIAPDFTSLDVLTFAGDKMPKGINVPNYRDIKEKEGFKNVIFEQNKPVNRSKWERLDFMTEKESNFTNEFAKDAYKVMVAGHELFGHGSGKLIFKGEDGKCPTTTDPLNGQQYSSCYDEGETYQSRFGDFSSSYEECRADLSGLFLQTYPDVYAVFDYNKTTVGDLFWLNLMGEIRKGITGLPVAFNTETKSWGQAHTQGAFVITNWILRNQKSKILTIDVDEDGKDFDIFLNKENLVAEGHELVGKLLNIMQVYKSTGALDRAQSLYKEYSSVTPEWLKIRDIIKTKRKQQPLRLFDNVSKAVPHSSNATNLIVNGTTSLHQRVVDKAVEREDVDKEEALDSAPVLVNYDENIPSVIYSFVDRFRFDEQLLNQVIREWLPHKDDLRVNFRMNLFGGGESDFAQKKALKMFQFGGAWKA